MASTSMEEAEVSVLFVAEIIEKLVRPPPLIRPSVSIGAAPPEAVSVMRQCWAEPPDLRPDTDSLLDIFRHLHRGRYNAIFSNRRFLVIIAVLQLEQTILKIMIQAFS